MNMVNRLTRMVPAIEDGTESRPGDSQLGRYVLHCLEKVLEDDGIIPSHIKHVFDVFLRDDEHVHRSLRTNVTKSKDTIVFENFVAVQKMHSLALSGAPGSIPRPPKAITKLSSATIKPLFKQLPNKQ
jgi:hypothetical protein